MSDLPDGWSAAELQDLVGPDGIVTDGDWIESKDQDPDGEVRLIQLMDIGDGVFLNKSRRFLTHETAKRLNCTFLNPGDVLVARMPDPLGRACVFPGVDQPAVTAVDVLVWRGGSMGPHPAWLMQFINAPEIRARIALQAGGTTRQRISGGRLKNMEFPLPPLPEQRRIVAKLDRLSARSRAARDHLARTTTLAARAKQAILAAAFRGDLTADWRKERTSGGEGPRSAEAWKSYTLKELAKDISYGFTTSASADPTNARFLRITDVQDYAVKWESVPFCQDAPPADKMLKSGDIVIARTGATTGKSFLLADIPEATAFASYLIRVRASDAVRPAFLWKFMWSPAYWDQIMTVSKGTAQPGANATILGGIQLSVPPLDEQDEIVARLGKRFARIDRLTEEAGRAAHLLDRLDERLLARAFRGELVPQDPADEPAAHLLARIREARAAAPKPTRRRRAKA